MQYRTLESLCKIASGGTPSRSKKEYWDGGDVPWIKIGNIKSKVVSNADEYITEAGLNNSSAKLFKKGTILYTIFATLGEVGILDFDACTNQAIAGVSIEKPEEITADYLYYYLKSKKGEVNKIGRGVAQNNINLSILRKFLIPMRAIEEQKTIVNSLNKIESIIEKQKQQLEQLNNLIKARFVEMFGTREKWNDANWKIASIDEIIEKPKSGEWGQKDESGRGIGVIRTTNFSDGGAVYFNSITTRDIPREKLITKGIKNGDILIEKSGGSDKKPVGRVVLYTGESNKYLNNNFTAILRINNNTEVNNIFLFTFLYINYWQGGTKVFESKTTGIHNLNLKEFLNKTKIALPDMLLQNQFATFVAQVDKSKFAVQKSLEKTQLLFDSLMQEYFG